MGVVVCSALLHVSIAGCSDRVALDAPDLSGADAQSCRALLDALPDRVADQGRRRVEDGPGYAAAWGDPAIELVCGVSRPPGLDRFAGCQEVNGVGWFIPESQQSGDPGPITMTTVGREQFVEVRIPVDYFPPAAAMVDLAPAVEGTVRELKPCV